MSESDPTVLSQTVFVDKAQPPGIGRLLSQGAAAGAIFYFLFTLMMVLSRPSNGYNLVFIGLLAILIALGIGMGMIEGLVVWIATRIAGRNLHPLIRAAIPTGIIFVIAVGNYFRVKSSYEYYDPELLDLLLILVFLIPVAITGFVTGSRLQPWRALTRGSEVTRSRVFPGLAGLILRSLVLFGLMNSLIALACALQAEFRRTDLVFTVIALAHFIAATMIVFTRIKLWLLFQLALIINFPVVLLITEVLKSEPPALRYAPLIYLGVWAAFLLARWRTTYSALRTLKAEFRYYLID